MIHYIKLIVPLIILSFASCELDNYEPPTSTLTGTVTYDGKPIGVRSGGVQLELWQPGFALNTKIPVNIDQEGRFSASLFDGTYKLTFLAGNGPWVVSTDTIVVHLNGSADITVPAEPYYTISEETVARNGENIEASFRALAVNDSRALQSVGLYVGTTAILDNINNKLKVELPAADIATLDDPISLAVNLGPELSSRAYVYARIGVRTSGVNEMLFSPVFKINR
ncbi:MAG TPA: DUF3823 domain-containing protein [Parapedobacter sp.]|nr:DUF3823 domain-containing protein [Parapedobacter sp.]